MIISSVMVDGRRIPAQVVSEQSGCRLLRPLPANQHMAARAMNDVTASIAMSGSKSPAFSDADLRKVRAPMMGGCSRHQRIR